MDTSTLVYINQNKGNIECHQYSYVTFVFSIARVPLPIQMEKPLFKTDVSIIDVEQMDIIVIYQSLGTNTCGSNAFSMVVVWLSGHKTKNLTVARNIYCMRNYEHPIICLPLHIS